MCVCVCSDGEGDLIISNFILFEFLSAQKFGPIKYVLRDLIMHRLTSKSFLCVCFGGQRGLNNFKLLLKLVEFFAAF